MEYDEVQQGWDLINQAIANAVGNITDDVYDDARVNAPYDSGELYNSIDKDHTASSLEGEVSVSAEHWADVEYGTAPHEIHTNSKKVLSDGGKFFGKTVHHPGTEANPFMRNALYKQRKPTRD